jgi:hypothetical protein
LEPRVDKEPVFIHGGLVWIEQNPGGSLIQPGNSLTLAFSANVPGPGTYHLTVNALYFDGSTESWQTSIVVSNPSLLGIDIRTLVYILAAIVILLPVGQSIALALKRRGGTR